ncbi:MAG: carbohydrate ABC transporter permease [Ruminococcus sp.]
MVFTLLAVPIQLVISFFLAVALNQKIKGIRFFRGAYFLPSIASMVSISIVWQWLFNTDFGIVNYVIKLLGGSGIPWLTSTKYSLWTIIIVSCWKGMGYNMMIFLAGLQGVPSSYYEAAEMDGCVGLSRLIRIVVPLIKPTTLYVSITCVINSMQVFDQVMIITGGGPARSSSVMVQYLYENAFDYYKMGYASAIGLDYGSLYLCFIIDTVQNHGKR